MQHIETSPFIRATTSTHAAPRETSYRNTAAVAAILSSGLALASLFVALPAVDYDLNALSDVMAFLGTGEAGARLGHLSMILDLLGYYLLIVPATLCLGRALDARAPSWVRLFTGCVVVYALVGAVGAAILAATFPWLMNTYASSSGSERVAIEVAYRVLTDAVHGGLWNLLEQLVAGVGWLGLGWLSRPSLPKFGALGLALGLACLADGVGNALGLSSLASVGLYSYLLLAPTWALCLGVLLLRRPDHDPDHSLVSASSP